MRTPLRKHRKYFAVGIITFWIAFGYLWGVWGWNDSTLFSKWWYFDLAGHALAGFALTITVLFIFRNSIKTWLLFGSKLFITFSVVSTVSLACIIWEFIEASKDIYSMGIPNIIRAQNSSFDNMADIAIGIFSSLITMLCYNKYNAWYWSKYPNDSMQNIATIMTQLAQYSEEVASQAHKDVRKSLLRQVRKKLFHKKRKN